MVDGNIQDDILAAEEALRQALLAGTDTRPFHERLAILRAAQVRADAEKVGAQAAAEAEAAAAHQARIAAIADRHAVDAATRISSRLAAFALSTDPR